MKQQTKATLFALTTVLIWSTVASAFKISLRHLEVAQLLFFSSLASMVVLGCVLFLQNKLFVLNTLKGKDFALSLCLGFLNPFAYYLVLFKAYDLLPAQEAQPLNYTWAITLSLLSVPLLHQRLRSSDLAGLLISYCGVFWISVRGDIWSLHFSSPLGVALALLSTVLWALYWIYNTKDALDPVLRLFLNFCCGSVYIALFLLLGPGVTIPEPAGLMGAVYVGVFEMGITFVLWSLALRLSKTALQVSIFIYLSPFFSLVLIHFLVGETILQSTIIGLILIMTGIGLQQLSRIH